MTKKLQRVRTAAAIKADAVLLAGVQSRAVAEAATTAAPSAPAAEPGDAGEIGELWLYGVVGGWWRGFDAESVSRALRDLEVDTLYVRIHSPGGNASDGIAIGNLLRNHKARVVAVIDGLAASAASVIAIAADEVVMCPGSQMMLHDVSAGTWGNAAQLRREADWVDGQSNNYAGVYAFKAGGDAAKWRAVMLANEGDGTWYSAEDAVTAGLADSVGTRAAVSSPPVSPEDQLEEDLEDGEELLARVEHDLALLERDVHPAARAAWNGTPYQPPAASAPGSNNTQGTETAMTFTSEQLNTMRDTLGLTETADEAAILAAVEAVVEDSLDERPAEANTPQIPEGMSLVSTEVLNDLRQGAQDGREARNQQRTAARDAAITAAVGSGRIAPSQREHFASLYDADPTGTATLLESLAPGLVPVEEVGHAGAPENNVIELSDGAADAFASGLGIPKEALRG